LEAGPTVGFEAGKKLERKLLSKKQFSSINSSYPIVCRIRNKKCNKP
jgi:hypothetical protein